jgi:isoleucyl-tRNA synthetase
MYIKTLNLPKTDFPMKANLSVRENEILDRWEELEVYYKILKKNKDKKKIYSS